ncbi:hypothetical protein GSI_11893 [Ganoderma sinense ZZ0214-1]|uniref:Uncharacterized protein n=1 Tax=Ganoderma sinense ZZ0214-1 TaxID=1077348 RepID=A0A2G8RXU4_9APHY|nr:hypothetical protein GSI_11893 [Ganoderma sinense ZZ0214-1]
MRTIQHFSLQMPDDFPFFENEEVLVRIRNAALYHYRCLPDLKEMFIECSEHLMPNTFVSLLPGFEDGDGEKALDIGLRYYSGCTVKAPNIDRALYVWEAITDEDHEWASVDVTQSLLARAYYSCLAFAYFELHDRAQRGEAVPRDTTLRAANHPLPTAKRDDKLANDLLYPSAVSANAAVAFGLELTSPAVLHTRSGF